MKPVHIFIGCSLDGYIAGPNHEIDWLDVVDTPGEDYGYSAFIENVDTLVMGRNTFDKVLSFDGPFPYTGKKVYVVTSRPLGPQPLPEHVIIFDGEPAELVKKLKTADDDRVIYADGGMLISNLLEHKLVDSLTLSIIPVILGSGINLFNQIKSKTDLKLIRSTAFPTGLVQLVYNTVH